ncbi:MAG TPA: hypothetical protein VEB21_16835 [Terriglobales bacterium]|nr:hypothetical protein [Terriglobales bacterium]
MALAAEEIGGGFAALPSITRGQALAGLAAAALAYGYLLLMPLADEGARLQARSAELADQLARASEQSRKVAQLRAEVEQLRASPASWSAPDDWFTVALRATVAGTAQLVEFREVPSAAGAGTALTAVTVRGRFADLTAFLISAVAAQLPESPGDLQMRRQGDGSITLTLSPGGDVGPPPADLSCDLNFERDPFAAATVAGGNSSPIAAASQDLRVVGIAHSRGRARALLAAAAQPAFLVSVGSTVGGATVTEIGSGQVVLRSAEGEIRLALPADIKGEKR